MVLSVFSFCFNRFAFVGFLRIRWTSWLIDAGWPIARRSAIQSFPAAVRLFTSAAQNTDVPGPTPPDSEFWIDLNPRLRLGDDGGELFLDRRYAEVDVVTWGHYFTRISGETAEWAAGMGLKGRQWQEGGILKVPKLEGSMTLWRTVCSQKLSEDWASRCVFVDLGVLIQARMDLGQARVFSTTAKSMGWNVRSGRIMRRVFHPPNLAQTTTSFRQRMLMRKFKR